MLIRLLNRRRPVPSSVRLQFLQFITFWFFARIFYGSWLGSEFSFLPQIVLVWNFSKTESIFIFHFTRLRTTIICSYCSLETRLIANIKSVAFNMLVSKHTVFDCLYRWRRFACFWRILFVMLRSNWQIIKLHNLCTVVKWTGTRLLKWLKRLQFNSMGIWNAFSSRKKNKNEQLRIIAIARLEAWFSFYLCTSFAFLSAWLRAAMTTLVHVRLKLHYWHCWASSLWHLHALFETRYFAASNTFLGLTLWNW